MSERIDEILEYVFKSDKPVYILGMLEDLKLECKGLMNHGVFFLWQGGLIKLDRSKKFATLSKYTRDTMNKQKAGR